MVRIKPPTNSTKRYCVIGDLTKGNPLLNRSQNGNSAIAKTKLKIDRLVAHFGE
jgi:hypothetical protein